VAALVIEKDAIVAGERVRDLVPDAEIGAERIGEHHGRRVFRATNLVMQNYAVDARESHAVPPPSCGHTTEYVGNRRLGQLPPFILAT
jgi:hypothetical protein